MSSNPSEAFDQGVLYACAFLVRNFDQPSMAAEILNESGADVNLADETDLDLLLTLVKP